MTRAVGVVVIGRNEGARLSACLDSLARSSVPIVYVDSGSTDGSPEHARSVGCEVVDLDLSQPFTAARARNVGYARLRELHPEIERVQFVDGDCVVEANWLAVADQFLDSCPAAGVVSGRRREKDPDGSPYNRLIDMEWEAPPGDTRSCGGDAMFRVDAFDQVAGFDASLIAGEEPDLCVRLRRVDWRVIRLDEPMTIHDADVHSFLQWWRREMRAGHAYGEGLLCHFGGPERFRWRAVASIVFWGGLMPLVALVGGLAVHWAFPAIVALGYAVLWSRTARQTRPKEYAVIHATGIAFGKIPEFVGVLLLIYHRSIRGRSTPLIEYKREA